MNVQNTGRRIDYIGELPVIAAGLDLPDYGLIDISGVAPVSVGACVPVPSWRLLTC